MTTESSTPWHDYVLARTGADDVLLRETLAQACPECRLHLDQAESELAALGLALLPVVPASSVKNRVLARIAGEVPGSPRAVGEVPRREGALGPQQGLSPGRGRFSLSSLSSLPGAYRVGRWVVTSSLVAVVVLVGALLVRIEGRTASLDGRIDSLLLGQERTASGLDAVVADLQNRRSGPGENNLSTNLSDNSLNNNAQLGSLDRQLRDLRMVLASVPTVTPSALAAMRAEREVLASEHLTTLSLVSRVTPDHAVVRLFWDRDGGRLLLAGTGMPALQAEQNYVLWLRAADGSRINSGMVVADAEGAVRALITLDPRVTLAGIDITVEASSGRVSGTPDIRYHATVP